MTIQSKTFLNISDFEILRNIEKKYSVYDFSFDSGYIFSCHKHDRSSELFYVLSGTIKLTLFDEITGAFDHSVVLKEKEAYLINPGIFHECKSLDNSRVIVIVQPPLIYRTISDYVSIIRLRLKKLFTK